VHNGRLAVILTVPCTLRTKIHNHPQRPAGANWSDNWRDVRIESGKGVGLGAAQVEELV
jgi:hypothetical protein